jgi:hypothetical protein
MFSLRFNCIIHQYDKEKSTKTQVYAICCCLFAIGEYDLIESNRIESTNSIELRIDDSSRTSLHGLSVLLRNGMFIFTLTNPSGSILKRRPGDTGFK